MNHHHQALPKFPSPPPPPPFAGGGGGGDQMVKRSPSEYALTALVNNYDSNSNNNYDNNNNNILPSGPVAAGVSCGGAGSFDGYHQQLQVGNTFVNPTTAAVDDLFCFPFKPDHDQDFMNGLGGLGDSSIWHQHFNPQQTCISATIDSQSSHSAGSPTSILKPNAGDNQVSGSSEEEDVEIEAGPCEQSNDPRHDKRIRRKESNRESARRSRKRKQEHLKELENQVEALRGENVTLFEQLGDAALQLRDASTNNRVLKSDVEALRAKVKLAEDRVTRGPMLPSLSHILPTQLGSPQPQMLNPHAALSRLAATAMSPTMAIDDVGFGGLFQGIVGTGNSTTMGDHHILNANGRPDSTGLVGSGTDGVSSCVTELWP